jgi:hypothetical protein
MATTYREIAIEDMLRTVEQAISGVIEWWGDLPHRRWMRRSSSFATSLARQSIPWNL